MAKVCFFIKKCFKLEYKKHTFAIFLGYHITIASDKLLKNLRRSLKMTKLRKFVTLGTMVLVIGSTSIVALATSAFNTPAEVVAELSGKSIESIITEKAETGKTCGTIAKESGKLEEFKSENLEKKKEILSKKVSAGTITQEKANEIIAALEKNQVNCDGTGSARIGKAQGAGFGRMNGNGKGQGSGVRGNGMLNDACQMK